eukprot:TRINITY_DN52410_c0_g1_i1.p2 TRINITY_DN52410_c0_g1~~TRINITY_DN52410_c0_g1_i1.p2  ORF type:complete len:151 (+),score=27.25 TRINITY_DN52410_c0_g1_i1:35-487(+)
MSWIPLGTLGFDPLHSLSQIACIQAGYYLVLTGLLQTTGFISGRAPDLDLVFVANRNALLQRTDLIGPHLLAAAAAGYLIHLVVERSRRCPDNTATLYLIHVIIACAVRRPPRDPTCFIFLSVCGVTTLFVSRQLCIKRELAVVSLKQPV